MMETLFNIVSADYLHMIVRFLICLLTNWVVVDLLYYQCSSVWPSSSSCSS